MVFASPSLLRPIIRIFSKLTRLKERLTIKYGGAVNSLMPLNIPDGGGQQSRAPHHIPREGVNSLEPLNIATEGGGQQSRTPKHKQREGINSQVPPQYKQREGRQQSRAPQIIQREGANSQVPLNIYRGR